MRKLVAAELFAGGGGLAVGLADAGFSTSAAVEIEKHAAATFRANHSSVQMLEQDVRQITGADILRTTDCGLDLLAACPPCQGFSSLTSKWHRADARNELVGEVARLVEEIRPRAVMIENVPGLVDKGKEYFDDLIGRLSKIGYVCNWSILQVADYGVPQSRRRLVLLAGLGFKIEMPAPTHSRNGGAGLPMWLTLRDALKGVPLRTTQWSQVSEAGGPEACNWHVTRKISEANLERLPLAKPGAMGTALPEKFRPKCHQGGYNGFRNVYGRLSWDLPSATITAGCLTPSKGRFGHPDEDRTISLREAALLQTFPPAYRFETKYIDKAAEIVGNALPCRFASAVASAALLTLNYLDKK